MDKDYIEVKIPILDSVDEMKVAKTFNQEQLWFVCAIAKAFEKSEQQCKKQKEVIDKVIDFIKNGDLLYLANKNSVVYRDNIEVRAVADRLNDLLKILEDKEK